MALTKLVDGKRVDLTPQEEAEKLAKWAANETEQLRGEIKAAIKAHAIGLMSARIAFLDSLEKIQFIGELWPVLNNPASNPDLAYCRDVYLFARDELTTAETASAAQLQGYDLTSRPWPA